MEGLYCFRIEVDMPDKSQQVVVFVAEDSIVLH